MFSKCKILKKVKKKKRLIFLIEGIRKIKGGTWFTSIPQRPDVNEFLLSCVLRFAKEQVNVTREFTHLSKHRRLWIHNSVSGLKCNFLSLFSGSAPPSNTRAAGSSLNNTMSLASQLPFECFGRAPLRSALRRLPSPRLIFASLSQP